MCTANDTRLERALFSVHLVLPASEAQELWATREQTLESIVNQLRETWQEDGREDGPVQPQVFVVLCNGQMAAILARGAEASTCHTLYADGRSESHCCHYVVGPLGYERTEISKL